MPPRTKRRAGMRLAQVFAATTALAGVRLGRAAVQCYAVGGTTEDDTLCQLPFYVQSRVDIGGTSVLVGKAFQACAPVESPYEPSEVSSGANVRAPNRTGTNTAYWCPTASFYSTADPDFQPSWGFCWCEGDDFSWPTPSPTTAQPTDHPTAAPTTSAPTETPTRAPSMAPTRPGETRAPTTQAPAIVSPSEAPSFAPGTASPAAPATNAPATPTTDSPAKSPVTESPAVLGTDSPGEPATDSPSEPATESPSEPATESPSEPATESPSQPTTSSPSEVATGSPSAPALTASPSESATGSPSGPTTGSPSDPTTASPSESTTGSPSAASLAPSTTYSPSMPTTTSSPATTQSPTTTPSSSAPTPDPTFTPECVANSAHDNDETDVDCGGQYCGPCVEGQACAIDSDCVQGTLCVDEGRCRSPANITYVQVLVQAEARLRNAPATVMQALQEGINQGLQNSSLQASSVLLEPADWNDDDGTPTCATDGGWAPHGTACALPFQYQGRTYSSCVNVDDVRPYWGNETAEPPKTPPAFYMVYWCATTEDYSSSDIATREQWGFCDCGRTWPTAHPTARPTTYAPTNEQDQERPVWCDAALRNENTTNELRLQVLDALSSNATSGSGTSAFLINVHGPLSGLDGEVGVSYQEGNLAVAIAVGLGGEIIEATSRDQILSQFAATLSEALRIPYVNETLHEVCA